MKTSELFPGTYLNGSSYPRGAELVVTIAGCERVNFDDDQKPVLQFVGQEQGLVLNKTMTRTLLALYPANDTVEWVGMPITLYWTSTEMQGQVVGCIRIRDQVPVTVQAQPTVPQPTVPQPTVPQPTVPQPVVPQPTVPQPVAPQPVAPQVTLPPAGNEPVL